jgi:hypothetical protein
MINKPIKLSMRKLIICLLAILPFAASAQRYGGSSSLKYFEIGAMGGTANYWGDLSKSPFGSGTLSYAVGAFGRYNIGSYVSIKAAITHGRLQASDAKSGNAERNLSFRSPITEFALTGEWNILGYAPDGLVKRISPYLFAGVAVYNYNPQAEVNGTYYALQPLGTEGQFINSPDYALPYRLTQTSLPFGLGLKFAVSSTVNLGLELGARYTFNDYLDDVSGNYVAADDIILLQSSTSQGGLAFDLSHRTPEINPDASYSEVAGTPRGNGAGKDMYFFGGVSVSYNFLYGGGGRSGCPTF